MKNILNLSKLFIKENQSKFQLYDFENKRINTKSLMVWVYALLIFAIIYLSLKIIRYFQDIGKPEIFLNAYFLFIEILIIVRTIMMSTNIFYFSQDIEKILHLPFKPREILISKFLCILYMNYETEILFGFLPLLLYGNLVNMGFIYGIKLIPILILFPILWTLLISILMIILMKTIRIFKNKDVMQIAISFVLIFALMFFMSRAISFVFNNVENIEKEQVAILNNVNNKIIDVNRIFLNINPSIEILQNTNSILNIGKIFGFSLLAFGIFIFLGNQMYLKQLLKANFYTKKKRKRVIRINSRKNKISVAYVKKEFKSLLKNPIGLIQTVYPVISITFSICILFNVLTPKIIQLMNQEDFKEQMAGLVFNAEAACIIIGIVQIVGLMNYCSVTCFSKEGKNAYVMKYLPISLYKQIIYKNIPQIVLNTICSIAIFVTIHIQIPAIEFKYIILMFMISFFITMVNSFILSVIDLLMPKIKWDSEYEILKNNKNKILQYALLILNILFLVLMKDMFEHHNLDKSLYVFLIFVIILFGILNFTIYKLKNKLFKNIN